MAIRATEKAEYTELRMAKSRLYQKCFIWRSHLRFVLNQADCLSARHVAESFAFNYGSSRSAQRFFYRNERNFSKITGIQLVP